MPLGHVAGHDVSMEYSPPPPEKEPGQVASSSRVVEQQPPDAEAQLQAQLIKTLQDAMAETVAMDGRPEKAC